MPDCPHCHVRLRTVRQRRSIYFFCDHCRGRAVTLPQIRRVGGDRYATALLRQMNRGGTASELGCPFCRRPMKLLATVEPALELDACRPCNVVWFDPLEFETVPEEAIPSTNEVHLRAAQAIGLHRIEQMKMETDRDYTAPPDETWKWLPGAFGMPVEMSGMAVARRPWFMWRRRETQPVESVQ